jgi:hypothetical protein
MQSDVGPVDYAAIAGALRILGQQVVGILIDNIETYGLENVPGAGVRTNRLATIC